MDLEMAGVSALLISRSPEETVRLGSLLGKKLRGGEILALTGALGSGKTTFVKGVARGLGVKDARRVTSPTFVILHRYEAKLTVYHLDLFRLESAADVEAVGWDDLTTEQGAVILVEWAKKFGDYLPSEYLDIELKNKGGERREIIMTPRGPGYEALVKEISAHG